MHMAVRLGFEGHLCSETLKCLAGGRSAQGQTRTRGNLSGPRVPSRRLSGSEHAELGCLARCPHALSTTHCTEDILGEQGLFTGSSKALASLVQALDGVPVLPHPLLCQEERHIGSHYFIIASRYQ